MLDKAIRDLDRERAGLQSQEKKLIIEIKKMAKQNQMARSAVARATPCLAHPGAPTFPCAAVCHDGWSPCDAQLTQRSSPALPC